MATSRDLPYSITHGSTEVVDHPCTLCQIRDKKEIEAVKHCVDCNSDMCSSCSRSHERFPALEAHKVVDINMKPRGKTRQPRGGRDKTVGAKLVKEVCVRMESDEDECNISGMCILPDGSFILADFSNDKMKRMNAYYNVTDCLDLPGPPKDVCYINKNEIAVSQTFDGVQIVDVRPPMKAVLSFEVDNYCWGIAHSDGEIFICCGNSEDPNSAEVQVRSLSGTKLRSIAITHRGEDNFFQPHNVIVNASGSKLYVSHGEGISVLDKRGNELARFSSTYIAGASYLCWFDTDELLVSNAYDNKVQLVTGDGKSTRDVLQEQRAPAAICYDCVHSRLLATFRGDAIKVYDVVG